MKERRFKKIKKERKKRRQKRKKEKKERKKERKQERKKNKIFAHSLHAHNDIYSSTRHFCQKTGE